MVERAAAKVRDVWAERCPKDISVGLDCEIRDRHPIHLKY